MSDTLTTPPQRRPPCVPVFTGPVYTYIYIYIYIYIRCISARAPHRQRSAWFSVANSLRTMLKINTSTTPLHFQFQNILQSCQPALSANTHTWNGWLLKVYILATSKFISGQVPTCDSAHSWLRYSTTALGDQAASTMNWYHTQWHYPDTESTSHCPVLIMPSAWLGSDKYQVLTHCGLTLPGFEPARSKSHDIPKLIQSSHLVCVLGAYVMMMMGSSCRCIVALLRERHRLQNCSIITSH